MGVAVAQDVRKMRARSRMLRCLGRNMGVILPNEKLKAETSNDFVTTRFCRVIQVEWSLDLCFCWNFFTGCLNSDGESDEGQQCQQVENECDKNNDHQRAGSDIIERITHGDGQRHAAQPSAHQEPAPNGPKAR